MTPVFDPSPWGTHLPGAYDRAVLALTRAMPANWLGQRLAILFRRLYFRDRLVSHAFLTAGLVVAAFSQLHYALAPDVAFGVVTSGDVLRLGFNAILFLGVQAELQADLAALRGAMAHGNWSGCHSASWDLNAPDVNDLEYGTVFKRDDYMFGIMVNANGERFSGRIF